MYKHTFYTSMKEFKINLREPIQIRALMLFFIFLSALIITTVISYISTSISDKYQQRLDNQSVHESLGEIIIAKLTDLETELGKFPAIEDPRDLALTKNNIENIYAEIQEVIQILQNGGTFTQKIPVNFDNVDEIESTLTYTREEEGYVIEALELLPRILDLENITEKLISTVDERLSETDPDLRLASIEHTSFLLKQADTLLLRSRESANRIYNDSNLKKGKITEEKTQVLQRVRLISNIITLSIALTGGGLSLFFLQQINDLLKDRKEAEDSLRDAESRYRTVADFTYDWEYWRNPDGSFRYVSPACERITGYSAEYILRHPEFLQEIVIPEDKGIWEQHGLEIEQEHTPREICFRIYKKDGSVIWLEHTCQPVTDPTSEFVGYRASNRDISERMTAQTALSESESLYRSLVENASIGILLASPSGQILSVNAATLEMLGSPSKEATKKINLLSFPPLIKSGFAEDFQTCLGTEKTIRNETPYISKWGKNIYTRYTFTAIRDAKEELIGIQILFEDITEQTKNKDNLKEQVKNLASINAINTAIINREDLDQMITSVVEEIAENLSVDAADLLVYDEHALTLTCTAQYGFISPTGYKKTVLRVGEGYAGEAALRRKTVRIDNLKDGEKVNKVPERWQNEDFLTYFGIPLLVKGELKGILEIFHRSEEKRTHAWMSTLEALAQQAAIAIDNHFLLDALRGSNLELELAYETTLEGWARALELRDYETKGHTDRVTELALDLARELGVKGEDLTHIRRGALLHDIGKIAVSDTILLKEGKCTPEEWALIQQHPEYGYDMLKEIKYLKPSLDIVLYHHEKWDGSGYPRGLSGESIPFSARLFAIIDVWDALTNDRPYHEAWTQEKALAYIQKESGKHFDPRVVTAFNKIIRGENE